MLTACSESEQVDPSTLSTQVSIQLSTNALQQRTTLQTSDNVQHVDYVQLYVFKGTDANAVCQQSLNVDWKQPTGATAQQNYVLDPSQLSFDGNTPYTFLAVGLDNQLTETHEGAGPTYNLPAAIGVGTTLGQAVARLADGKLAHDMAHAELFAGYAQRTLNKHQQNTVSIDLYRRVAGVQTYLTDIPEGVDNIQLVLYQNQHSEVPLMKQDDAADGSFADHGSALLANSQVLIDLPVTEGTLAGVTVSGTTLAKQAGAVIDGAYVLPIEAPTQVDECTMSLQLYKKGTLYKTYRVAIDNGNKGKVYNYPLRANYFYSIGILNNNENEPLSLGEAQADITLQVEPNFEKDHVFDIQ